MNINLIKEFKIDGWSLLGLVGQVFFFLRFFLQWIASEKKGKSHIPLSFWYYSIVGTILLGIYAYIRRDIIYFIASVLNLLIYIRNLKLINKKVS